MKTLCALFLTSGMTVALAMAQLPRLTPIEAEVTVVDPQGVPIEGAEVAMTFPLAAIGRPHRHTKATTDKNGVARLNGEALQDYYMGVRREGYYEHREPVRTIMSPEEVTKNATGLQRIRVELRPIVNPVVGVGRLIERRKIPSFDTDLGFDLFVGDWVAPHGNGTTADFILRFSGRFASVRDYDQSVQMRFPLPGDGILPIKVDYRHGSALDYPYEAPTGGYSPEKIWRTWHNGKQADRGVDPNAAYIIRFRTELDEQGKVKRAMYGILGRDLQFGGDGRDGFTITFSYMINPDWSRNIEFDVEKSFQNTKRD